jgi:hypothetical protein
MTVVEQSNKETLENKGSKNKSHFKKATHPGDVVSVDKLESSITGFIGQMTGRLIKQLILGHTILVDHASDLSYVYHQTSMISEETVKSKLSFKKFAATSYAD